MCGIAGFVDFRGKIQKPVEVLVNMSEALQKRGPDDEGYIIASGNDIHIFGGNTTNFSHGLELNYLPDSHINIALKKNIPVKVAALHRRLSIIDLSVAGHQPMADPSGKYWIVFNGEIYNYRELRHFLEKKGFVFRTKTDTEVLLYGYMYMKEKFLDKLQGMFAFMILDIDQNMLFIARDRLGIKPLFYFFDKNVFVFSSNVRAILKSSIYQKQINWEALWHNFAFGFSVKPLTVFDKIIMLEAGYYLKVNIKSGDISKNQYWEIPVNADIINDFNSALEQLEQTLFMSVSDRLIADVEVASFLSGGIDSGLITTFADKKHKGIKAFTLTFPSSEVYNDELERARLTAKKNNLNQIETVIDAKNAFEYKQRIIAGYEEPFPQFGPTFLLAKKVKDSGIKVVLSGLGADELFAGYAYYASIFRWRFLRYIQPIMKLLPPKDKRTMKIRFNRAIKDWEELYALMFMNIPDEILQKLFLIDKKYDSLSALKKYLNPKSLKFRSAVETFNYYDLKFYVGSHNLYHSDQFFMDNSIEGRVPFLDHRLVELAFKLPDRFKIRGFLGKHRKYILKKIAEKYLPFEVIYSPKTGFNMPVIQWIDNKLHSFVKDIFYQVKKLPFFNSDTLDFIYQSGIHSYIWHIIMFYFWYEAFFIKEEY